MRSFLWMLLLNPPDDAHSLRSGSQYCRSVFSRRDAVRSRAARTRLLVDTIMSPSITRFVLVRRKVVHDHVLRSRCTQRQAAGVVRPDDNDSAAGTAGMPRPRNATARVNTYVRTYHKSTAAAPRSRRHQLPHARAAVHASHKRLCNRAWHMLICPVALCRCSSRGCRSCFPALRNHVVTTSRAAVERTS